MTINKMQLAKNFWDVKIRLRCLGRLPGEIPAIRIISNTPEEVAKPYIADLRPSAESMPGDFHRHHHAPLADPCRRGHSGLVFKIRLPALWCDLYSKIDPLASRSDLEFKILVFSGYVRCKKYLANIPIPKRDSFFCDIRLLADN